ncbi:helix-turn-helix transcriptional regulator [Rufibacter latericius]|uniref:HTH luxR-type domain-containing protein n=1 Tax=Rufibacter latericius TaxID=2487040 RepID=A0A3M9MJU5_9BACT|nr:LuxR C-terminal-related transcriptional regulator [Rufibacter latericius]RNI25784.1 hypothetical protein EFB08_13100 [Rufibacter latericius]
MELLAYESAQKIWRQVSKESTAPEIDFELEVHKKLLNIFQVGDYYYFIFNCPEARIEFVSDNVQDILGFPPENFTVPEVLNRIHPDDLPCFLNFENAAKEFFLQLPAGKSLKYKVRYDFRIRKADGNYLRILHQTVTIQADEAGAVLRSFVVHTDISHLKHEGKPVLSFIGLDGEPSYIDVNAKHVFCSDKDMLSKREKEILSLLISGKHSTEIGKKLYISQHTVNTHRRNILAKTGSASTSELVAKAVREGWL